VLFKALKEEVDLPIHFHTHDTSGIACGDGAGRRRSRGVDAVDAAMDALSGNTSQPTLGSIVEALRAPTGTPGSTSARSARSRTTGRPCAPNTRPSKAGQAPASEVYLHEMPGGQFTNLKAQARSMGLETAGTRSRRPMPT
jgi:pyruvate carboxylase